MTTVSGSVDRIVFRNEENGFCVARFRLLEAVRGSDITTIVGALPSVREGEMLRLEGEWQTHPVHGRNFRVERFEQELPNTIDGIERYLGSGAITGIGPITASRIVDTFGERTLEVIDQQPDLLREIAGISAKRLKIITKSWEEQKRVRDLMIFLQRFGISVALAPRIHAAYGERAQEIISNDPYRLAHDIQGVGFRTADSVAGLLGISRHSPSRYVAGLRYTLAEATDAGHVFLPRPELLNQAAKLLGASRNDIEPSLLELLRRGDAVADGEAIYLTAFYKAENGAAELIERILETPSILTLQRRFDPGRAIREAAAEQGLALAERQVQAAEQALRCKVSILTGGPGTGKTSTLRTVITALERADISFCLCAPTGRAARRVAETTGRPAATIHRLLEFQPAINGFNFDQSNPLPYDFVVVDEVSMLDTILFYHLLKAIPPESHLLLVGDRDQLPSVGPGNVLSDLIASEAVPSVVLTDLFRQARGSQIVLAAHRVNHGEVPEIANGPEDDLFLMRLEDEGQMVEAIKRLLLDRIPHRFGLNPVDDVQVISPMHAGPAGVSGLNTALQDLLNPPRPGTREIKRGDRVIRAGDKVMQIRNNYDKDVYNGDVGRVVAIQEEEPRLLVGFPTAVGTVDVEYETAEVDELALAYAVSVHKAQGSEFPAVVMPLVPRHRIMLQRNLLYTAITRARQLCVLVGSPRALELAAANNRQQQRNTRLGERLRRRLAAEQLEIS